MCTNTQSNSDLAYLNINCMCPAPNDPTFPYLFYKNKDVASHNNNMLLAMPGNEIVIDAIDEDEENHSNVSYHSHMAVLPPRLVLKLNMLVEICAGNYDSQDGLVNGANGIIKSYTKTCKIDTTWIKFHDPKIGQCQSTRLASLYTLDTSNDWTPILRSSKPIANIGKTRNLKI